ncbi:MAG: hypothetical protein ACK4K8_00295 [Pannonibacter sp.]
MARFPMPASKVAALGRVLAEAGTDPSRRQALIDNPKAVLAKAGVPAEVIALFDFTVVCDTSAKRHVVLPYRYNPAKLDRVDEDYLNGIADSTLGTATAPASAGGRN